MNTETDRPTGGRESEMVQGICENEEVKKERESRR